MDHKSSRVKKSTKDHYWNGVFTGVFLGCFIISLMLLVFIRVQGFKVAINPEYLAKMVQMKVQAEARQDIPQLLEGFKDELPTEIGNHLDGLENLTIGFGSSQVKLPEEMLAAIKTEFNRILEATVLNTLNHYDTTRYQERIGENVYRLIKDMLHQEIIGKTYVIKASQWFSVPVRIVGSSGVQPRIGI